MELLLTVLLWIVGIVVGLPIAFIFGIFLLYAVFIFIFGIACIPIAFVSKLCGNSKKKEGE